MNEKHLKKAIEHEMGCKTTGKQAGNRRLNDD